MELAKRDEKRLKQAKTGQQKTPLTVLLLGRTGLGMSTYADMLLSQSAGTKNETAVSRTFSVKEDGTETPCSSTEAEAVRPSDATVRELNADLDAGQKVQVLDVRGLEEDGERNLQLFENIVNMISRRHLACLETDLEYQVRLGKRSETRSTERRKAQDTRVHVCLYFMDPTLPSLALRDVAHLQKLQTIVNVIPVVARCDMLTDSEKATFKANFQADIASHAIVLYPNSLDAVDVTLTDGESSLLYQSFKSATRASPFAIVSACDSASDASQAGRKHGWGIVDVVSNSDVAALRSLLLGPLSEDLRGRTVSVLYDYFRADKFSQLKATPSSVVAPA